MMRASHRQPGFAAALVHRLSGIALAIFLPFHFLALAIALNGAAAFDRFLTITNTPVVKVSQAGLVFALAAHMSLGLRLLAIEFLDVRERTSSVIAGCAAIAIGFGLAFLLNAG
jgi:fumarate reductase subunit D